MCVCVCVLLMADTAEKPGYHFEVGAAVDVWGSVAGAVVVAVAVAVAFKSTEFTTCWNFYAF